MKRSVKKVAVLGSGIMGSRIACHFANIGVNVLLLDILPKELSPEETKKGFTAESAEFRNRIVNTALQLAITSNPSPLYKKSFASLIRTGNFSDGELQR
jgi:3-hydroxyacyl-CoA dehydrogenase